MKPTTRYLADLLDFDAPEAKDDLLWRALAPSACTVRDGDGILSVPFQACRATGGEYHVSPDPVLPLRPVELRVRAYGERILRLTCDPGGGGGDESEMLELDPGLKPDPLAVAATADGWELRDGAGRLRLRVVTAMPPLRKWSDLIPPPPAAFRVIAYPDGRQEVPFMAQDAFFPKSPDSLALAWVERQGRPQRLAWSLLARQDERFAGTGERFAHLDLRGRTLQLENLDALGVNNRRAYKNVPFYLSSAGYGCFVHTSNHLRLSLADLSTRAVAGMVEEPRLDLFLIGGDPERILDGYRRITGRPRPVPRWSYGTWMSRMSYWTAEETRTVARRLREGGFPCDVIHLDTGWFEQDWRCDWAFSREKYPDPAGYLAAMRADGFRISLWQMPKIIEGTRHWEPARRNGFVPGVKAGMVSASNFAGSTALDIDFSNPAAERWYREELLKPLLKLGAACIKTDFGEEIDPSGDFRLPYEKLHNRYALLYQRAAWEATREATGEGIIWARSAWAGAQRYGVHWGGDCGCTFEGLAGTIRGGLHLGCSGFAFWSHDVPGFHGVPDFMNSWPADDLYVRWTQVGVFSSHLRFHGANPREPYEYPAIADTVRGWLRLRYCLIPYLEAQAGKAIAGGMPILRALLLDFPADPRCWTIDDQFLCGEDFLVAPILNAEGRRTVYLPAGRWRDLWTGDLVEGPRDLQTAAPLGRCPVWVRDGATIPIHAAVVQHTGEMDPSKVETLRFDAGYRGFAASVLGRVTGLG